MNELRPTEAQVVIGRLRKKIAKLMKQRDEYKNQLEYYKVVLDTHPWIERKHRTYTEGIAERKRIKDMETRLVEQAELITLLKKSLIEQVGVDAEISLKK
jgi:uncharacterized coiled-coil protein SlyX